jgi:hypothetical protein
MYRKKEVCTVCYYITDVSPFSYTYADRQVTFNHSVRKYSITHRIFKHTENNAVSSKTFIV